MKKDEAIASLKEQIDKIRQVRATRRFGATFKKWHRDTRVALENIFPNSESHVHEFNSIQYDLAVAGPSTTDAEYNAAYIEGLEHAEVFLQSCIGEIEKYWKEQDSALSPEVTTRRECYVSPSRIEELAKIQSPLFDLSKLVAMCRELNKANASDSYYALIMLTRAVLDHVPPIFGCSDFSQVAAQCKGGKSVKDILIRLDTASRKIADMHLHQQIRKKEPLPNRTQVNSSNELDVLLSEVIRVLT